MKNLFNGTNTKTIFSKQYKYYNSIKRLRDGRLKKKTKKTDMRKAIFVSYFGVVTSRISVKYNRMVW